MALVEVDLLRGVVWGCGELPMGYKKQITRHEEARPLRGVVSDSSVGGEDLAVLDFHHGRPDVDLVWRVLLMLVSKRLVSSRA